VKWIFFDKSLPLVEAFRSVGFVAIQRTLAEAVSEIRWRFLITPGNSFGIMDGGIDKAVVDLFGKEVQGHVQSSIQRWHGGFCPVGSVVVAPLPNGRWLVYAPTMEIPQPIRYTLNVYWATRAAALRIKLNWAQVAQEGDHILCPGLGTLTGRLSPAAAAMQMEAALGTDSVKAVKWPQAVAFVKNLDRMKSIS
jgi:O-acetyl-ADP-ribose deacetylase (regulator of RNase III)